MRASPPDRARALADRFGHVTIDEPMTTSRKSGDADARRGLLARPLDALVFLLPMLLYYEIMSALRPERVIAFHWTRGFFELFGYAGM
ncbi:MAG: hypothetical protein D6788_03620, partial [Planctomycetota bacterium]